MSVARGIASIRARKNAPPPPNWFSHIAVSSPGIWGGLWCLPEFDTTTAAQSYMQQSLVKAENEPQALGPVEHAFTHFDLVITPLLAHCRGDAGVMDAAQSVWYDTRAPARIGLPAPIKTLLEQLATPPLFAGE